MHISKWCLGVGAALAGVGVVQGDSDGMTVDIGGVSGTEFTASWHLVPADGGEVHQGSWGGAVPQTYVLPNGQLDLTLMQTSVEGRLEVTVTAGGNRSRSATHGQGSRLQLSVR